MNPDTTHHDNARRSTSKPRVRGAKQRTGVRAGGLLSLEQEAVEANAEGVA